MFIHTRLLHKLRYSGTGAWLATRWLALMAWLQLKRTLGSLLAATLQLLAVLFPLDR